MAPQINDHSRSDIGNIMARISILLFTAGIILILVPAFRNQGIPTLNNYIPVIIDPLYYCGLFLLALGILISVIRVFKDLKHAVLTYRGRATEIEIPTINTPSWYDLKKKDYQSILFSLTVQYLFFTQNRVKT